MRHRGISAGETHLYLWTCALNWPVNPTFSNLKTFPVFKKQLSKELLFWQALDVSQKAVGHLKRLFQASVFAWFIRQILWRILFKLCFLIHSFVRFLHGTLRKHQLNVFQTVSALCLPLVVRGGVSFPSRVVELLLLWNTTVIFCFPRCVCMCARERARVCECDVDELL